MKAKLSLFSIYILQKCSPSFYFITFRFSFQNAQSNTHAFHFWFFMFRIHRINLHINLFSLLDRQFSLNLHNFFLLFTQITVKRIIVTNLWWMVLSTVTAAIVNLFIYIAFIFIRQYFQLTNGAKTLTHIVLCTLKAMQIWSMFPENIRISYA